MATITRDIPLATTPEHLWDRLRDVGGINTLIDMLGEVTVEGDRRTCSLGDRGTLDERILSVDAGTRRVAYTIRESPFGFEHHSASMQAVAGADGTARLVWITDFAPDALAPAVEEVVDNAAASISRALGAA
ncbi:MAG: SRPBCC family protein [Thermoleophilia bacterium]